LDEDVDILPIQQAASKISVLSFPT